MIEGLLATTGRRYMNNIIEAKNLKVYFPVKSGVFSKGKKYVKAVDNISLSIKQGETLALVGESGSGKTTFGRAIIKLIDIAKGEVIYKNENILNYSDKEMREIRKDIQIIFQDPYSSLNPRKSVGQTISEVLKITGGLEKDKIASRVKKILGDVGLSSAYYDRYPHEFSGGQRQRIAIARAISINPEFIVCDEPVSALDVSIQSQVINLLMDLKDKYKMTYLFISHDLNVVHHIADRVAVMYLGKVVELAETDKLFVNPQHPYTKALLSASPTIKGEEEKDKILLTGEIPSAIDVPSGCRFRTRCWKATELCAQTEPAFLENKEGHYVACHYPITQ